MHAPTHLQTGLHCRQVDRIGHRGKSRHLARIAQLRQQQQQQGVHPLQAGHPLQHAHLQSGGRRRVGKH